MGPTTISVGSSGGGTFFRCNKLVAKMSSSARGRSPGERVVILGTFGRGGGRGGGKMIGAGAKVAFEVCANEPSELVPFEVEPLVETLWILAFGEAGMMVLFFGLAGPLFKAGFTSSRTLYQSGPPVSLLLTKHSFDFIAVLSAFPNLILSSDPDSYARYR